MKVLITESDFNKYVECSEKPVVIKFYADWCGPCRITGKFIDELESEYAGKVSFFSINVDSSPELSGRFQVASLPTIIIIKNGKEKDRLVGGVSKVNIQDWINKNI